MIFGSKYTDPYVQEVESIFYEVLSFYISREQILGKLFDDVYKKYNAKNRHYHNMKHIYNMCMLWQKEKTNLKHPRAIFLAIIYHDIIYVTRNNNNEEKSANYFLNKVSSMFGLDIESNNKVYNAIRATKHNDESKEIWKNDKDIQLLLDFDLAILGTDNIDEYEWYRKGVRKEYRIFPNILYKPGRKKVLESFLQREKIYLTPNFKHLEKKARKNLKQEINSYLC